MKRHRWWWIVFIFGEILTLLTVTLARPGGTGNGQESTVTQKWLILCLRYSACDCNRIGPLRLTTTDLCSCVSKMSSTVLHTMNSAGSTQRTNPSDHNAPSQNPITSTHEVVVISLCGRNFSFKLYLRSWWAFCLGRGRQFNNIERINDILDFVVF